MKNLLFIKKISIIGLFSLILDCNLLQATSFTTQIKTVSLTVVYASGAIWNGQLTSGQNANFGNNQIATIQASTSISNPNSHTTSTITSTMTNPALSQSYAINLVNNTIVFQ